MKHKTDNLKLGIFLGLITPVLVLLGIYFARFAHIPFNGFVRTLLRENGLITFFGSWFLVANIALLTLFFNTQRDKTAKGVFAVSLVYGLAILLLKLFN